MPFPYSNVLDTFGAAVNDQSLTTWDSNWTRLFGYSFDWLGSTSPAGTIKGGHATSLSADYYDTASYGPNSEVYVTVTTLPASGKTLRLYCRIPSPGSAESGYRIVYTHGAPGTGHIQRLTAGATTSLVGPISLTLAAGDKLGFDAVGNILTGYKYTAGAWAAVSSLTYDITPDGTKYTAAGYFAIATDGNVGRFKDFGGGTAGAYILTGTGGLEICSQSLSTRTSPTIKTIYLVPAGQIATVARTPVSSITKVAGVAL